MESNAAEMSVKIQCDQTWLKPYLTSFRLHKIWLQDILLFKGSGYYHFVDKMTKIAWHGDTQDFTWFQAICQQQHTWGLL